MLTPQNFREKTFERALFGGYDMRSVDDFLDEAANDYAAVAKDNMVLKSKMKVLVEKIEEYRSTEDSMRATLLAAQKLCTQMEQEAKEKADAMIAEAKLEAERIVRSAHDQRISEEAKLQELKKESSKYIEDLRQLCAKQVDLLESLESSDFKLSSQEAPFPESEPQVEDTVRSIENSFELMDVAPEAAPEIGQTVAEEAVKAAPLAESEEPTRLFSASSSQPGNGQYTTIDNLRFGK